MKSQKINSRISNKKIEKIGDYFQNSINKVFKGYSDEYLSAYVIYHWEDIVGENIAKNVFLADLSDKTLSLYARHPAWAEEIKHYEEDIISKANAFAGKNLVKFIKFLSVPPKKKKNFNKNSDKNLKIEYKLEKLSDREEEKVKETVSRVRDKDLRKTLERYGILSKQAQNYRRDNLIKCKICGKFCGVEICNDCRINHDRELKSKIVKLLSDLPYLSFADASREIPELSSDMFNKVRLEMLQRLAKKINAKDGVTFEAKCLTMLYRSIPPEFITDDVVKDTLKRLRYDLASSPIFSKDASTPKKIVLKNK